MAPVDLILIAQARKEILARYPARPPVGLQAKPMPQAAKDRDLLALASIYAKPLLGVSVRAATLEMTDMMLRRTLGALEARDWLRMEHFSKSTRGYIRLPNITEDGLRAANLELPEEGSGGFLHRKLQAFLRDKFASLGHKAGIEVLRNGKHVDVAFLEGENWIALECGLSSAQGEVSNIVKDFAAGFSTVRALLRETGMIRRVEGLLEEQQYKPPGVLKLELISDYLVPENNNEAE